MTRPMFNRQALHSSKTFDKRARLQLEFLEERTLLDAQVGSWTTPFNLPVVAVHVALMRTGEVLMWDGHEGGDTVHLWNPTTGVATHHPYDSADLFCSGHAQLADGRLLVMGGFHEGHGQNGSPLGENAASIFDPTTRTWTTTPNMAFNRWYPTATTLPNGQILATSGGDLNAQDFVPIPEVYNPTTNTWTQMTSASLTLPLYPYMFVMPDGRVLNAGSDEALLPTRALDYRTGTWSVLDTQVVDGGSAVLYGRGKVMKAGSSTGDTNGVSDPTTYVMDVTQASPTWRQTAPMAFPRTYHNLTALPDGNVLVTGGGRTLGTGDLANAVYPAEMWSPATETWTTMASMSVPRLYHSTALLLPDGRVLVSGGGRLGGDITPEVDQLSAQIYSPPYLFKGARPTITTAPGTVATGSSFFVGTPDPSSIASVSLVRLGANSHSFDHDQRFINLSFSQTGGGLSVQAPPNLHEAPPGYYMLFLVNQNGVPSVASMVRVTDLTPPQITNIAPVVDSGQAATITWTTNEYTTSRVEYSSAPDELTQFVSSTVAATTHKLTLTGLNPNTTYYYRIIVTDELGNSTTTPTGSAPLLQFTTPRFLDTTVADFTAGSLGSAYLAETSNGELMLAPATGQEFIGSTLPSNWSVAPFGAGGSVTISGGKAHVDGARFSSNDLHTPGQTLEFVATFGNHPFQSIGLGNNLMFGPWALFTCQDGTTLRVRTASPAALEGGEGEVITTLTGNWLNVPHRFRIDWTSTNVTYYIDGVQVASHAVSIPTVMKLVASDFTDGFGVLQVDWMRITPYSPSATYISRVIDAGEAVHWTPAWNSSVPTSSSLTLSFRQGDTPTPDASWTNFTPVASGTPITGISRYGQYQTELSTNDPNVSPVLENVRFSTRPLALIDTFRTDFNQGTFSNTYIALSDNGEVTLAPAAGAEFSGGSLPAGWSTHVWNSGGSATLNNGQLTATGVRVGTDAFFSPGRSLEFVATFSGNPYQAIGLGNDFNSAPWAVFTTFGGGALYARTAGPNGSQDTQLSGNWFNTPHRFRIDWTSTNVTYFIDGTQVASHNVSMPSSMRPLISDYPVDGGNVTVNWLRLGPYSATGSFLSRIEDAGTQVTWNSASWTHSTPTSAGLSLDVRMGNTPTPDATWTDFVAVANSGDLIGGRSRYLQYRTNLSANSSGQTPELHDVTIPYTPAADTVAPRVVSRSPAPGATDLELNSTVVVKFSELMNSATITTANLRLRANGASTDVPATLTFSGSTATLTPNQPLAQGTTFQVTLAAAVADVSGNALGSDLVWSFTTLAPDTTPPTVTNRTPSPGAIDVERDVQVQVTFSEAMNPATITTTNVHLRVDGTTTNIPATLTYSGLTATLRPDSLLVGNTVYRVTVSGNVSDAAGNLMGTDVTWTFSTVAFVFVDRTTNDFTRGTLGANTYAAQNADGEVTLAPALGAEFSGGSLPAGWSTHVWNSGGSATLNNGQLTVTGVRVGTDAFFSPGRSLEFVATFSGNPYQAIGLGNDFNGAPWANFTTRDGGQLFARTAGPSGSMDTALGNVWINTPHRFRIDWTSTNVTYFIDGTQVASHNLAITANMRPLISDYPVDGGNVTVNWLRLGPYSATGSFLSRIEDAGTQVTWNSASWTHSTPTSAGLSLEVRMGNTPTPDATWTDFVAVANSGDLIGGRSRYLQYRTNLSANSSGQTPELHDVTIPYTPAADTVAPRVVSRSPAPGATDLELNSTVVVKFSELMNSATITTANLRLRANGASTDVPATLTFSGSTATLTPSQALVGGTTYQVTVAGVVADVSGNTLGSDLVWSFTTTTPDTTPPTVTNRTPAPGATSVNLMAPLQITFSEAMNPATITTTNIHLRVDGTTTNVPATLSYSGLIVTLQPTVAMLGNTVYRVTVSGTVTDAAGNPLGSDVSWTFTTGVGIWQQGTAADFNSGTHSGTAVGQVGNGEVQLASSFFDEFGGTSLGSSWNSEPWAGGGPVETTVSGGILSIRGTQLLSVPTFSNAALEARLNFPAVSYQHFGMATNLGAFGGNYWAIFSTAGTTNTLFVRVNASGVAMDVSLGALPTGFHVYRVQPIATGFEFYIDDVLRSRVSASFPVGTALRAVLSTFSGAPSPALQADWVRVLNYPASGTFTSAVFDATRQATWGTVSWAAQLPPGTTIIVETRSGNTATPDASWSAWAAATNGSTVASPSARFLQYRVRLETTSPLVTPLFEDIVFNWS